MSNNTTEVLRWIGFMVAMPAIAACGYYSAVIVFYVSLEILGDTEGVRVIVGPLDVFTGLCGMIGIPGGLAMLWQHRTGAKRSE